MIYLKFTITVSSTPLACAERIFFLYQQALAARVNHRTTEPLPVRGLWMKCGLFVGAIHPQPDHIIPPTFSTGSGNPR
jgi:hypothetical protein